MLCGQHLAILNYNIYARLSPRARESSTARSRPRRMRRETEACPVGTRGARSRASQVASIGCPVRARGGAKAERRGLSCFLPLVEVEFRSRRRRRDRDRGDRFPSCLHERRCVAAGTVDDAERRPHVVGVRCGRLRCAWGRLPIGIEIIFGPALPPCGTVGLPGRPTVLKVKRRAALGGFSVCWSLFRSLVPRVRALFLKPIFERA